MRPQLGLAVCFAFATAAQAQPCRPTVFLQGADGASIAISVEEARSPQQRAAGLMHRKALKSRAGMWFVFDDDRPRSFWMRNTLIALDLIFVRADGTIANVIHGAEPGSEDPLRSDGPVRYVLEVVAGQARNFGWGAGQRVTVCGTTGPKT
jgi:uncharacterized membrane protein (UPF0127 family)